MVAQKQMKKGEETGWKLWRMNESELVGKGVVRWWFDTFNSS